MLTFFMGGIKEFYGEEKLQKVFENYWYIVLIPAVLLILEMILVFLFFKKIILLQSPCLIIFLFILFILFFGIITCMSCLTSVVTCMFFEGLLLINILSYIIMNSIKALENKNIIKLLVIYLNTFSVIVIYIAIINKRYIIFFILATSSVLYFSYANSNYKRLVITNFPFLNKEINENEYRNDLGLKYEENILNKNESENEISKTSLLLDEDELREKKGLEKFSIPLLTKLSFVASFVDTTVFNFS